MTALTHTTRHVHVPITWIVLLVVALAVAAIASAAVGSWEMTSATTHVSPVAAQPVPHPVPGPMAMHRVVGRTLIGEPYPSRAGADGWLA